MWDLNLPGQGLNPHSLKWKDRVLAAELPWQSPISDPLSLKHGLAEWASWAGLAAPGARVSDARGQLMPEKGGVLF